MKAGKSIGDFIKAAGKDKSPANQDLASYLQEQYNWIGFVAVSDHGPGVWCFLSNFAVPYWRWENLQQLYLSGSLSMQMASRTSRSCSEAPSPPQSGWLMLMPS